MQAVSGKSSLSSFITRFKYIIANVDEAHQLVYDQLAPVTSYVDRVNMCMDEGQLTGHAKKLSALAKPTHLDSSRFYP